MIRRLEVEADEMASYMRQKANKQWLWIAMDSKTRQVIAFHVGDRSRKSAKWKVGGLGGIVSFQAYQSRVAGTVCNTPGGRSAFSDNETRSHSSSVTLNSPSRMHTTRLNSGTVCTMAATCAPHAVSAWLALPATDSSPEVTGSPWITSMPTAPVFGHHLVFTFLSTMILDTGPPIVCDRNKDAPDSPTPPLSTTLHASPSVPIDSSPMNANTIGTCRSRALHAMLLLASSAHIPCIVNKL
jgi:IS1 family transposase